MSNLVTAETFYDEKDGVKLSDTSLVSTPALWCNWHYTPVNDRVAPADGVADVVAHAFVNGGKWRVRCPFCSSSQIASETDRRFYCIGGEGGCQNFGCGHKPVPVTWPEPNVQVQLEAALLVRPQIFQNWEPGETVEDMLRENEEHVL